MSIVINNVKFIGEDGNIKQGDIKVTEGKIAEIGSVSPGAEKVIEGNGRLLTPGLVDVHVHLREPGGEHKETIETGTKAAARGGFTTICPMPNTRPVPDSEGNLQLIQDKIKEKALVKVLPYASITTRQLGKELVDFARLKEMGAFAFTDDGVGIQDASMMLAAMKAAARAEVAIVAHCEENTLINKGSVHEGTFSEKHGLNGIPSVCESVHIARDVLLAEAAGAHYHVCHVSTKESVRVIRDAKRAGIHVTAEVSPHHLLLCDEDIQGLDPNFKMNPPLRAKEDRDALLEGLQDGTIDFIATDHAPHAKEEKEAGIEKAPFGIVGLETAFPLLYTHLVKEGHLSLADLVSSLTKKPAEVFGLTQGTLQIGASADLTLIDLEKEEKIDVSAFESKGKNTPFEQWVCQGWPVLTLVDGVVVYEKEEVFQ